MSADPDIEDSSAPLIEHLAELRTRLIRSAIAFVIALFICFAFAGAILDFLLVPIERTMRALGNPNPVMQYTDVVVPLAMNFFLGFADLPSFAAALFETGDVAAAAQTTGIDIVFNGKVNESLDITLKMILAFGLCFQLPVLLTLMGKAGLVSAEGLKAVRKYAVVGILLVAGLVTPPDVFTQVILFTVVYGLYEVSIFLVRRVEKEREVKLREEGLWDDELDGEGQMSEEHPEDRGP